MERLIRWEFEELMDRWPGGVILFRARSLEEAIMRLKERNNINLTSTEDPNVFKDTKTEKRYKMTCKESEGRSLTNLEKEVCQMMMDDLMEFVANDILSGRGDNETYAVMLVELGRRLQEDDVDKMIDEAIDKMVGDGTG
jgi:hypothetical protein